MSFKSGLQWLEKNTKKPYILQKKSSFNWQGNGVRGSTWYNWCKNCAFNLVKFWSIGHYSIHPTLGRGAEQSPPRQQCSHDKMSFVKLWSWPDIESLLYRRNTFKAEIKIGSNSKHNGWNFRFFGSRVTFKKNRLFYQANLCSYTK